MGKRKPKAAVGMEKKKAESAAGQGEGMGVTGGAPAAAPLNAEQAQAVTSPAAALAVIAGPGTGKTKTLVERIAHLVEVRQISPSAITAVTFTNQAAEEMRQRLEDRLGGKGKLRGLTVGTFHAICLRLLPPKPIVDPAEAIELMRGILERQDSPLAPQACLGKISAVKNGQDFREAGLSQGLYESYNAALQEKNLRDLDDLLLEALEMETIQHKMFTYLLVDEFQDINPLQHRLIRHWSSQGQSLFVIGDPDQSIYGFRGANARCFEDLKRDLPTMETITLRHNYRSTPAILTSALALIRHNPGEERALTPHQEEKAPPRLMMAQKPFDAAVWIAKEISRMVGGVDMVEASDAERQGGTVRSFGDIAVLCRTRHQLELMETCLRHESIPCVIYGREDFLQDPAVMGALGFFRFLGDPSDIASLEACLRLVWGIPAPLAQRAAFWALEQKELSAQGMQEAFADHDILLPFARQAEAFLPKLQREKPRRLLQQWVDQHGQSAAMEKLLHASVFHETMPALLKTLLMGEEADLRRASGSRAVSEAVKLMTIHGSKGLEFPVVFLSADAFPKEGAQDREKVEEERRLFFVGMTRAKDELVITASQEELLFVGEVESQAKRGLIRGRRQPERGEQLSLF